MEKRTTLTSIQLEEIFAQIKKTGNNAYGNKIYNAYLPTMKLYAEVFNLTEEQAQDIYDEVISHVYNSVLEGVIDAKLFNMCYNSIMKKKCAEVNNQNAKQTEFKSEMLAKTYSHNVTTVKSESEESRNQQFATQSLLFVVDFLNFLENNPEQAKAYELDEVKIEMLKDYHGINAEGRAYKLPELAKKYEMSEKRAQVVLVKALSSVRRIKEFQPIKSQLHR